MGWTRADSPSRDPGSASPGTPAPAAPEPLAGAAASSSRPVTPIMAVWAALRAAVAAGRQLGLAENGSLAAGLQSCERCKMCIGGSISGSNRFGVPI